MLLSMVGQMTATMTMIKMAVMIAMLVWNVLGFMLMHCNITRLTVAFVR